MMVEISNNDGYGGVDLMSSLPDEIVHVIMSFLPMNDLTRFSTVSKRFLSATKSSPPLLVFDLLVFDFASFTKRSEEFDFELFTTKSAWTKSEREEEEDFSKRESFLNFVQDSIEEQRRRRLLMMNDYCFMQRRLSFMAPISPHYASDLRIDEMVNFALDNKFIDLNVDGAIYIECPLRLHAICRLSGTIFSAQAQHIRFLKLRGFRLDCDGEEQLSLSCPSIVDFSLSHCSKFKTINLCGANLKRVVLDSIHGLEKVNIDPQVSLESFSLSVYPDEWLYSPHLRAICHEGLSSSQMLSSAMSIEQRFSEINLNLHSYKSLKFLEIKNANIITDEWFQHHVSQFDLLETLKLDTCKNISNIYMSSNNLKTLELRNCRVDVKIIAVNLESFVFRGSHWDCSINIRSSIHLKHMDVLDSLLSGLFEMVGIDDAFTGCLSPFNLLENLKLRLKGSIMQKLKSVRCIMEEDICISMDSLKTLELENYYRAIKNVEIKALNLESFTFHTNNWTYENLDINSCINLRHIKLIRGGGVTYSFSGFPYLEKLELKACNSVKKIELYGGRCLKSLKLLDCISLSQVEIEAPNLVSFMFSGVSTQTLPSSLLFISPPSLVPKIFVTAPSRRSSDSFQKCFGDFWASDSFQKCLRDFLVSFSFHETVSLGCTTGDLFIFPKEMRENLIPPLCGVKHLKVEVRKWPISLVELVESLLCLAPCTASMSITLLNASHGNKSLKLKFHYKPEEEADVEDVLCREWCPIKAWWRRYLTKVEMVNFEDLYERSSVQNFLTQNAKAVPSFIYL